MWCLEIKIKFKYLTRLFNSIISFKKSYFVKKKDESNENSYKQNSCLFNSRFNVHANWYNSIKYITFFIF